MDKLPDETRFGKKISAIIYTSQPQVNGRQFLKYDYVDNSFTGLDRFMKFAAKFPGATHVNFYCKKTRSFIEQQKF